MKSCKKKALKNKVEVMEIGNAELTQKHNICEIKFGEYLGQTVTVYVNAGGIVGHGFTGVLIGHANTYIKLLVIPSVAPTCSLGNSCNGRAESPLFCLFCPHVNGGPLGTMVEIPITAIVAFVHNILSCNH